MTDEVKVKLAPASGGSVPSRLTSFPSRAAGLLSTSGAAGRIRLDFPTPP